MDCKQEKDAILKALAQDCKKDLNPADFGLEREAKYAGLLQLKDGTICVLVATDDRNIITSKIPLSPSQQEDAKAKAKALTGNSKTDFFRGAEFSDPPGTQEQHNKGTKE